MQNVANLWDPWGSSVLLKLELVDALIALMNIVLLKNMDLGEGIFIVLVFDGCSLQKNRSSGRTSTKLGD